MLLTGFSGIPISKRWFFLTRQGQRQRQAEGLTSPDRSLNWYYLITLSRTLKTVSVEKARSPGTVTVKLDSSDRDRIASLASVKKRTPHYLMKEAILEYVQREEARQNFIQAADTSFKHFKETGLHITLEEFSAWVDQLQKDSKTPIAECHG